jgi:hypothetical protein
MKFIQTSYKNERKYRDDFFGGIRRMGKVKVFGTSGHKLTS